MKKFVCIVLSIIMAMFAPAAYAFEFPEPDWGELLNHRRQQVSQTDFELYVEGNPENCVYYGAKLEPRAGTYIGMVAENSAQFEPIGSYLTYIQDFSQSDFYYPANELIENGNKITMVGWTVTSLDNVDFDAMRRVLDRLNEYNKPMFIRFANEMNISTLGDDPQRYVDIFRQAANMIHEYPNFAVVWSPNDMGALDRPLEWFYPGDEYVDWVGVSSYMTKYFLHNPNTTVEDSIYFMTGDYGWTTNKLRPTLEFMSEHNINKPVMISEGGVVRTDYINTDYSGWHESHLRHMLWNTIMKYPQVKMINYFNSDLTGIEDDVFYISDFPSSIEIFKQAASNGAYLLSANDTPDFTFAPANNGDTLMAKNGIVKLYTLAYFPNQPNITVDYLIDGQWFHCSKDIPYTCNFDINSITDGEHKLKILANGTSREYTLYKRGQYMSFGHEPDPSAVAVPAPDISVALNGQSISFEQPPIMENGRVLVPLRTIFEALGATVEWEPSTRTVTSKRGNTTVKLTIGNNKLYKNGSAVTIDVPARLVSDHTMIPVRATAEAFGATVEWNDDSKTVTITE